jgi:hypothetical protein
MDRLIWTAIFAITLTQWGRGVSVPALQAIGDQCYSPTDEDPEGAARAYAERGEQFTAGGTGAPDRSNK